MSFKSGITEASKKNEEKMKGSTQGFSGGFCGSFFFLFGWFFCCCLVGFYVCGRGGVLLFSTICGAFCFDFVFPLYCFYQKFQLPKKPLNTVQSRD